MYTYYFLSLGCPKNEVDGEAMEGILAEEGFISTNEADESDIIIVNTCGFIEDAKRESIDAILEAAKYPGKLFVLGCLSQRYGQELFEVLPEIDVMLGVGIEKELREVLRLYKDGNLTERYLKCQEPFSQNDYNYFKRENVGKHYRYLKIAEGCNNHCSYCVIPFLRGSYKSRPMEEIVKEAKLLCSQGAKEIILIAQDTSCYGLDLYGRYCLPELLERLTEIKELTWLRILYMQPAGITDELLDVFRRKNTICRYLDIPLQHVNERILKEMNRWGNEKQICDMIEKIRFTLPDVSLRTTFIVGFPGESPEEFSQLLTFAKKANFDKAGAFKYSQEEGTKAASLKGQIADKVKDKRLLKLNKVLRDSILANNQKYLGRVIDVIIDDIEDSVAWGRTQWDAPEIDGVVIIENAADLHIGEIYPVEIVLALEQELVGEVFLDS